MPTATNKQRVLTQLLQPSKRLPAGSEAETRPVLEHLLYAVCREGTSKTLADKAFKTLQTTFFDWNEIRVSSAREIEEALAGLPDRDARAARIISLLQEIFETTYSFDLESLHKKGLKQAQKQLERYQGSNPFIVAYTLQMGLGGHALPLDQGMVRSLQRLDVLDGELDEAAIAGLEHLVPKSRGNQFFENLATVAHEFCHEKDPECGACSLRDTCAFGQKRVHAKPARSAARARARS